MMLLATRRRAIWTLLLAWPILGERIRGPQWLAALSTLAGLMLIIEPWAMHGSLFSKFLGVKRNDSM